MASMFSASKMNVIVLMLPRDSNRIGLTEVPRQVGGRTNTNRRERKKTKNVHHSKSINTLRRWWLWLIIIMIHIWCVVGKAPAISQTTLERLDRPMQWRCLGAREFKWKRTKNKKYTNWQERKKSEIYGKQWKSVNVYCKWPQAAIGQNTPSETTWWAWDEIREKKKNNKNSSRRLATHVSLSIWIVCLCRVSNALHFKMLYELWLITF